MSNSDFFPRKDADFLQWVVNFLAVLVKIYERTGFPKTVYDQLVTLNGTFIAKLLIADAPETRTAPSIRDKNDTRNALTAMLRQTIGEYLTHNHLVTDVDRASLGLPIHNTTRTPAPVADNAPDFEVDTSVIGRLTVRFFEKGGSHRKGKPDGQHCVEIIWCISDTPLTRWNQLIHSAVDTNSPLTLAFENDQRGKTVYFALCWENTRGENGPLSEIASAIIP
jgi:hypothetical protein